MKHQKRGVGLLLATLCTFTLLLSGCAGSLSSTHNKSQTTTKLTLQQMPGATATGTTAPLGSQVYLGQVPNQNAWVGINTDGTKAEAFVTDGSQSHAATFAQWFKGPVNNHTMDATASDKNGQDHLSAMLTSTDATGTVTLANGKSISFTANALSAGTATPSANGSATPSATETATPSATETATPSATETPSASATPSTGLTPGLYHGTSSANGDQYVAGWIVAPSSMPSSTATPSTNGTATPSATETATPSATSTASPSTTSLQQAGGVVNQKTYAVSTAPELTSQDVSNGNVSVPNLGTFKLAQCQAGACQS